MYLCIVRIVHCVDFPYVPFSRLPQLHRIAHEFYDPLPSHASLVGVIWNFIWSQELGPQAHAINTECVTRPDIYAGMTSTLHFFRDTLAHGPLRPLVDAKLNAPGAPRAPGAQGNLDMQE